MKWRVVRPAADHENAGTEREPRAFEGLMINLKRYCRYGITDSPRYGKSVPDVVFTRHAVPSLLSYSKNRESLLGEKIAIQDLSCLRGRSAGSYHKGTEPPARICNVYHIEIN